MNHNRLLQLVLGIGGCIALVALLAPELPFGSETWLGFAGIYLIAGVLHEVPRSVFGREKASFIYAILVAIVSTLLPISIRVWDVLSSRPELSLPDTTFVLWQIHVLVPFAVAFMAPLGIATTRRQQSVIALIIATPFFAAAFRVLFLDSTFGIGLFLPYYVALLFLGAIAGIPLYLYGDTLQEG